MVNNKSIQTVWEGTLKMVFQFWKIIRVFTDSYPNTTQTIQLTFIYFFAFIELVSSILTPLYSLNAFPEILQPYEPFLRGIIMNPIVRFWTTPEKVFFLSYLVLDQMVVKDTFKFSKLVKYNILFIFTLLMVQGLVISYWDLLFNPEMNMKDLAQLGIDADQGITLEDSSRTVAMGLFAMIFFSFLGIYLYCYGQSLQGVFPTLPGCSWLTDSVCFWIRIQTPTMRQRFKK